MRAAKIFANKILAGLLTKNEDGSYTFKYDDLFFVDPTQSAISLTLPKSQKVYHSKVLFPCFFNMLSEGTGRAVQQIRLEKEKRLQVDKGDHFTFLLETAKYDTIGTMSVEEFEL